MKNLFAKWGRYLGGIAVGIVFYFAAEYADNRETVVENGVIQRMSCGQGDAAYELLVEGVEDQPISIELLVPEQELTKAELLEILPQIAEELCISILGNNPSLKEVRYDLNLVKELSQYGIEIEWASEKPEVIGSDGRINKTWDPEEDFSEEVYLEAVLKSGSAKETLEIPVSVYPVMVSKEERFQEVLKELLEQNLDQKEIALPKEFEGKELSYSEKKHSQNYLLLLLGVTASVCLALKEREQEQIARKEREKCFMADYPDLVYELLILTGAGYSAKQAWKKLVERALSDPEKRKRPLYLEMQKTLYQMETGTPEVRAYAEFGRRCGIRSYLKFASLLESSVSTGGKNLRKLLEQEVDHAFQMRIETARKSGEMISSKLLIPVFTMLMIVLVMVIAPVFLTLN